MLHTKRGVRLQKEALSYSRAKELIKKELGKEGLDPTMFGTHSLRSGGAFAAAALGVPDRLLERHGCWRSEKAGNNYEKESLDTLLLEHYKVNLKWTLALCLIQLFMPTTGVVRRLGTIYIKNESLDVLVLVQS